jgi:hypothetical protein
VSDQPDAASTFYRPCLDCGGTIETVDGKQEPHTCASADEFREVVSHAYWAGHDRAIAGQANRVDLSRYLDGHVMQCPSEGAHDPHLFVHCPVGGHTWESVWLCNGFGPGYTHPVNGEPARG